MSSCLGRPLENCDTRKPLLGWLLVDIPPMGDLSKLIDGLTLLPSCDIPIPPPKCWEPNPDETDPNDARWAPNDVLAPPDREPEMDPR